MGHVKALLLPGGDISINAAPERRADFDSKETLTSSLHQLKGCLLLQAEACPAYPVWTARSLSPTSSYCISFLAFIASFILVFTEVYPPPRLHCTLCERRDLSVLFTVPFWDWEKCLACSKSSIKTLWWKEWMDKRVPSSPQELPTWQGREEPFSRGPGKAFGVSSRKSGCRELNSLSPASWAFSFAQYFSLHDSVCRAMTAGSLDASRSRIALGSEPYSGVSPKGAPALPPDLAGCGFLKARTLLTFGLLHSRSHGGVWRPRLVWKPGGRLQNTVLLSLAHAFLKGELNATGGFCLQSCL